MPFVSVKQRDYLKRKHPDVYNKFKAEHGTAIAKGWTLADLGNIAKADKPPGVSDETWGMPAGKAKQRKMAEEIRAHRSAGPQPTGPNRAQREYMENLARGSAKAEQARRAAHGAEAVGEYTAKYKPDRWAKLAAMPKVKGRYKLAAAATLAGGAALASPANKRRNAPRPGETPQEARERNKSAAKRALVGGAVGAGAGQGLYTATGYGGNKLFGMHQFGGRGPNNPQQAEINRHMKSQGSKIFHEEHPEWAKKLKESEKAGKGAPEGYHKARRAFTAANRPNVDRGYATMPHHIQGSGAARFFSRYYGSGNFGHKTKWAVGTGAAVGAGLAAGIPRRRRQAEQQRTGRPPLRLIQGGRAA